MRIGKINLDCYYLKITYFLFCSLLSVNNSVGQIQGSKPYIDSTQFQISCEGTQIELSLKNIPSSGSFKWRKNGLLLDSLTETIKVSQTGIYDSFITLPSPLIDFDIINPINFLIGGKFYFINEKKGFQYNGVDSYFTQDSSRTYRRYSTTDKWSISDIQFINNNIGFRSETNYYADLQSIKGRLYRTIDGGISWNLVYSQIDYIDFVYFINSQIGFIGNGIRLYKTINGGQNWVLVRSGSNNNSVRELYVVNQKIIMPLVGNNYALSTNLGDTFQNITLPNNEFVFDINFTNDNVGFFITKSNKVYKTIDGGSTWNLVFSNLDDNNDFVSIYLLNEQIIYLKTSYGQLYKSVDSGVNWVQDNTFYQLGIMQKMPTGNLLVRIRKNVGDNMQFATLYENSYRLWETQQPLFLENQLEGVCKISSNKIIGVGKAGLIILSNDNGLTWQKINSNTITNLFTVKFANETVGWIIGESGKIMKTIDGGLSWSSQVAATGGGLYDLYIKNINEVFIVGNNSRLQKTTNGGSTWTAINLGFNKSDKIYFTSTLTGFIGSYDSKILRTNDGGSTWTTNVIAPTGYKIVDIFFLNNNIGWVIARYNGAYSSLIFYKTLDGGMTWTSSTSNYGINTDVRLFMFDESHGILSNSTNYVLETTDGGRNWTFLHDLSWGVDFMQYQGELYCYGLNYILKYNFFNSLTYVTNKKYIYPNLLNINSTNITQQNIGRNIIAQDAVILPKQNIEFLGQKSLILSPPFEVNKEGIFKAFIGGCQN
jgi:photosystem II stability/assembly factor-like uncharacterized protein